jgi:hypothetical protein
MDQFWEYEQWKPTDEVMENGPRPTKQVHTLSLPTGVVLLANVLLSWYVFADDFIGSRRAQSATHFNNKNC